MLAALRTTPRLFLRPVALFRSYRWGDLRPDLLAGLTVGVVLLPQALVFALLAGLPPQMGLYSAIVAAIVGALWGSSQHLHTGPTNTASLLVFSTLLPFVAPGSPEFIAAAGLVAVMAGVFRLAMGLARLGILVNFVSDSVIVGFTAGTGILIMLGELRHLLRLEIANSAQLSETLRQLVVTLPTTHGLSLALGMGTALIILLLRRFNPRLPGPLIAISAAGGFVALFGAERLGLRVLGQLPQGLPPLAHLPFLDLELIGHLSTGALAIAAIGLVEATSIARSIAAQSGQRLDNNQEFVGQGLANIACGLFSGYSCSGSFNRSALNYSTRGRTALASVFSGLFVLLSIFTLAPLMAYVPRAALSGLLIFTAFTMIDRKEMLRIWRSTRGDALIMAVTLAATLLLPLQFAVMSGILMALAYYILQTSAPRVQVVLPDEKFRHFVHQDGKPICPQLVIFDIFGDLYFGAVNHIEETIRRHLAEHPQQRFVLLRMQSVDHCDISGIHMLESLVRSCREQGGDLFLTRVNTPVLHRMHASGFAAYLGADHLLHEDDAIDYLFHKVLDPALCIYECEVRAFRECQNLPKRTEPLRIPLRTAAAADGVVEIGPQQIWQQLRGSTPPCIIDVREPREFQQGHIPVAQLIPLPALLAADPALPRDRTLVLVCRGGRRSARAAHALRNQGYQNVVVLRGGMLAWGAAGLLEAVE